MTPGELIKKLFEFLLEREPSTSILTHFSLPVICQYFPEHGQMIKATLYK